MIWYLLYPFRGTTEPPILTPDHPLRRAFYRYGYTAARHWLACILLSVAVAVFLCYPVFFLYENPTTGFSKLPLHVWTSARLIDGSQNVQPDIVIRQIWVHGDHMGALRRDVLQEALDIQRILVSGSETQDVDNMQADPSIDANDGTSQRDLCSEIVPESQALGFHSPLMFWNCSTRAIQHDSNVLDTIYAQRNRRSYLNLTLRPTSVFAGKSFDKDKVVAADALVLTLFGRHADELSRIWERNVDTLSAISNKRGYQLYPRGGDVQQSRLYEFQQKPLSMQDNLFLVISYVLMVAYVVVSLGKLRAVKSWAGLLVTVMFEIGVSIIASFALCGLLKVDLARIPDAAYPFVVLVMGLENMFRLINAVLSQKPELPVAQRIAFALSEVGHLALATAAQMLFVLWLLAKLAPGIAPFCAFAAIALIFDFVFHLTFFLAVLSVDVRRMELSDLIDRAKCAPPTRKQSIAQERKYWLDALLQNRLPFSSRIAGSAISISFLLGLNMHFYESGNSLWALARSLRSMWMSHSNNVQFVAPPINQARTPAAWLRIQDYRYAQEVLQYVKPAAHSIIARVYDPLVIVLKSSDRDGHAPQADSFFALLCSLFRKHLYPFLLAVIFSVAFITLLMQYLLWNELPEEEMDAEVESASILKIENLPKSHRLDVLHIAGCSKGHLVSVSLDRLITFALFDQHSQLYSLSSALATAIQSPVWPVIGLAIDDTGRWAAICGQNGNVIIWNMQERRMSHAIKVDMGTEQPILSNLCVTSAANEKHVYFFVALHQGPVRMIDVLAQDAPATKIEISHEKFVLLKIVTLLSALAIVALTRTGRLRIAVQNDDSWITYPVEKYDSRMSPSNEEGVIRSMAVSSSLGLVAAIRLRVIDLVDIKTKTQIHSFPAILVKGHSLRILHSAVRTCKTCKAPAVHSLSLAYTDFESRAAILRTYSRSADHNEVMCLGPRQAGKSYPCEGLVSATEHVLTVDNPGTWETTNALSMVGVRVRPSGADSPHSNISTASGFEAPKFNLHSFDDVKKRGGNDSSAPAESGHLLSLDRSAWASDTSEDDEWEVWTLSTDGSFHSAPLRSRNTSKGAQSIGEDELLVPATGPMVRLGQRSIALGFGNRVKVIMLGNERFEGRLDDVQSITQQAGTRRRKLHSKRTV